MNAQEIKDAVDDGKTVYVGSPMQKVIKDCAGQYLIKSGYHCIGLTWLDGETLNAKPEEFYIFENEN